MKRRSEKADALRAIAMVPPPSHSIRRDANASTEGAGQRQANDAARQDEAATRGSTKRAD